MIAYQFKVAYYLDVFPMNNVSESKFFNYVLEYVIIKENYKYFIPIN